MSEPSLHAAVAANLAASPVVGVVRTDSHERAAHRAELFVSAGLRMVEITFSVPRATELVERLKASPATANVSVGMGTVTTAERAERAMAAGADFIVSPNVEADVARLTRDAGRYLVLGALTATEIVNGRRLGADLIKVYPLGPVGGPVYLEVIRQPLSDIPMLAAGGFGIEEIPAYKAAGAVAFGLGPPLIGESDGETITLVQRAIELATTDHEVAVMS